MFFCEKISSSIAFNCENISTTGTRRAWIINFNDIDSVVYGSNKMIIEDIILKARKISYKVSGNQNSIQPKVTLINGTFVKNYDHIVSMIGFDISPAGKENLQGAKNGLFVVIVENVFRGIGGNTAFEVYGIDSGLKFTLLDKDPNNADTQGGFQFTLANDKNKEPFGARTFFNTDYITTLDLIENLQFLNLLLDNGNNLVFDNGNRFLID